jgi:prepilin-type N-terminal cleavage/methylation domain-containing protein
MIGVRSSLRCATAKRGFTLIEILVVVAIIGMVALIAAPFFLKHRNFADKNVCISNLRLLAAAKAVWAQERNKGNSDIPVDTDLFGPTNYVKIKPTCPGGGADYMLGIGTVGVAPACSLSNSLGHILGR